MNGPLRMFPMREIVQHDVAIPLPTCMYSMRNLHSVSSAPARPAAFPDINQQNNTGLSGMAALEQKQERILKQLEELKEQMLLIRQTLKQSDSSTSIAACKITTSSSSNVTKKINVKSVPNLVIHSDPSHPPYSLLILKKIWADSVDLCVDSFVHSSVFKLPENTQKFVEALSQKQSRNGVPKVTITLIWNDIGVNKLEFLIKLTPMIGECNLLRFLARLTTSLGYDETNYEIDSFLDLSYSIVCSHNKTERVQMLQQISKKLGKSSYLFGESVCVADVALYSAIKQVAGNGEVNAGLTKWMQRCEC